MGYDDKHYHLLAKDEKGFDCYVDPWVGCAEPIDENATREDINELANQFIGNTYELTNYSIFNPIYCPLENGWRKTM